MSTYSVQFFSGDSTNMNTGWKGSTHALLQELLGRRLYWGIYSLHCNKLPPLHLINNLYGPTSSDKDYMGPFCSLLSKVNDIPYIPGFKALPGGEDLITLTKEVLSSMSSDQRT